MSVLSLSDLQQTGQWVSQDMFGANGVDGAHIWALDFPSRTALTLDTDNGARVDAQGRLTNSAQGAAFDLMQGALVGKELVSASFNGDLSGLSLSAFASEGETVFYISSRSLEARSVTLDLDDVLDVTGPVNGVKIALNRDSANGRQWVNGEAANAVTIGGQPYFYDEHDVDVTLQDLSFANAGNIGLTLLPFEVVQLTVRLGTDDETDRQSGAVQRTDKHYFLGTDLSDIFELSPNVTYVDTGGGVDMIMVDAPGSEASLSRDGFGKPVLSAPGFQDVTLDNVERIGFADSTLALDTDGTSGQAYRLYQASFDRTPDAAGLAFWIGQLDGGDASLVDVAERFLASEEFARTYGPNESLSDADYITMLYENVLDRSPDAAGLAFWQDQQEADVARAVILISFSESTENRANVAPAIDDGIWFG